MKNRVTDGDHWVGLTEEETSILLEEGLIHPCTGVCPTGTYHWLVPMATIEQRLEQLRVAKTHSRPVWGSYTEE